MEELYQEGLKAFEEKNFVEALKIFSSIDYEDSKAYENKCIDALEDLIFYSKKIISLKYLEELKFYKDYIFFSDAYKRKKVDLLSKILMFGSAIIGTIVLLILSML